MNCLQNRESILLTAINDFFQIQSYIFSHITYSHIYAFASIYGPCSKLSSTRMVGKIVCTYRYPRQTMYGKIVRTYSYPRQTLYGKIVCIYSYPRLTLYGKIVCTYRYPRQALYGKIVCTYSYPRQTL